MQRNKTAFALLGLVVFALTAWTQRPVHQAGVLELTYLDVGEGQCGVMRTPSGKIVVLDCGTSTWRDSDSLGSKLVAPYLQRLGADRIDLAVLSHPHSDHVSGYASLLAEKPAKAVLDIGRRHGAPPYIRFLRQVKKCGASYRIAKRGQFVDFGDGVRAEVLNPDPDAHYSDLNENSMVLRVTYGKVAMLLCADAGEEAERRMLESGMRVRAQVMQVGHHGSRFGTTPEWLAAVRPSVAIISCGRNDMYGHPSRQTLARLRAVGARTYRTDMNGAVTVTTDGHTIRVRTFRQTR
jgi:competence protein ComEC